MNKLTDLLESVLSPDDADVVAGVEELVSHAASRKKGPIPEQWIPLPRKGLSKAGRNVPGPVQSQDGSADDRFFGHEDEDDIDELSADADDVVHQV